MQTLRVGDVVSSYRVLELLGSGGMGEVYRAQREGPEGFRREVALKIIAGARLLDPEAVALFRAEALLTAQVHHGNVVAVLDYGLAPDGIPWLVEELVGGMDLACLCRLGALPIALALHITHEILRGLEHVHDGPLRLVHRDLKPSNVLIGRDGAVKIADFGLATSGATASQRLRRGSPAYLAPEALAERARITARSDLFAVGLILWEMLTGEPLCTTGARRMRLFGGVVASLGQVGVVAPRYVERLLLWLLRPHPADRCPSARAALRMLRRMREVRLVSARDLELWMARAAFRVRAGVGDRQVDVGCDLTPAMRRVG